MHLYEHQIATNASQQMTKVTEMVREDIERSGVREGIAVIFSPHTTAGFTINENADPDVVHDMLCGFEKVFPAEHMKTTVVGPSQTLIIHDGEIVFGIWQDLYFCEFDGPRNRTFYVKIIEG